jgi:hypothetical protein
VKEIVEIAPPDWRQLREHVFLRDPAREQAAFLFAAERTVGPEHFLSVIGFHLVDTSELAFHSGYHLELNENTWSTVIKEAHQKGAGLIEVHSHLHEPAEFSASDLFGLQQTAPHVGWRLKAHSFAALVLTRTGFDSLIWRSGEVNPQSLSALRIGNLELTPTCRSRRSWHDVQ